MTSRAGLLSLSLVSAVVFASGTTAAAPPPVRAKKGGKSAEETRSLNERARKLKDTGVAALGNKDYAGAYNALADSYRLVPEAETLYHLGMLNWDTGRSIAAHDMLRRFLEDAASSQNAAARREAQRILEQPRGSSGEVNVLGERGALVLADDRIVGMLPLPLPLLLSSGDHKITIELDARRLEGPVKVLPGRTAELRFNLQSDAVMSRVVPAAIVLPEFRGVPAEAQKVLGRVLEQSLQKQRLSAVGRAIALAQAPKLADCLDTLLCQDLLATQNEADYVLSAQLEARGDLAQSDWTLRLGLLDGTTGDLAAAQEQKCPRCGVDQAATALEATLVQMLKSGMARPRGILEVLSNPPGAEVLTTERKLGQTPYQHAAFAGNHRVTLKLKGYQLYTGTLVIEEGKKATLSATLQPEDRPLPAPPPVAPATAPPVIKIVQAPVVLVRQPRPKWRIAVGIGLIGAGLVLGGFGVSGLLQYGTVDPGPPAMLYETQTAGATLLTAGVFTAVGGAVVLAVPGPLRPAQ